MSARAVWLRWCLCSAVLFASACGPRDKVAPDQITPDDAAVSPATDVEAGGGGAAAGRSGASGMIAQAETAKSDDAAGVGDALVAGTDGMISDSGGATATLTAGVGGGMSGAPGQAGGADHGGSGGAGAAGSAGSAAHGGAADPSCDLNGIWIARLTTFSRDSVFSATQTASNWFYYELSQTGMDVKVSASMDCGIQVSGSADVTINDATTKALLHPNDQTGRMGQFYRDGDHCTFKLARFYSTRAVRRATYLPADTSNNPELMTLKALPTQQMPAGSEDWDGDGQPGIAFNVANLGSRHVVQRDWNEFYSDDTFAIMPSATEFVARANFDNQEQILAVSGGLGALLQAGSTPATDLHHRVTFHRLGRQARDPGVTAVRTSDDLQTCYKVQAALPHDKATQ